jgi:hypothetical protein
MSVKIYKVSKNNISLSVSKNILIQYKICEYIKNIKLNSWDKLKKSWILPLCELTDLHDYLKRLNIKVRFCKKLNKMIKLSKTSILIN